MRRLSQRVFMYLIWDHRASDKRAEFTILIFILEISEWMQGFQPYLTIWLCVSGSLRVCSSISHSVWPLNSVWNGASAWSCHLECISDWVFVMLFWYRIFACLPRTSWIPSWWGLSLLEKNSCFSLFTPYTINK